MTILGWIPKITHMPLLVKRDALLILALYLLNVSMYSAWFQLGHVATNPRLLLVWLYGLAALVPLAWRDKAPVAVFAIQWILTVAAFPIMNRYTPVVGIPMALYAVSIHYGKKFSLLAMLASLIPTGLAAVTLAGAYVEPDQRLQAFVGNAVFLVSMTVVVWSAGRTNRAVQQQVHYLERERETVREAVTTERRRIARELQDIASETTGKKAIAELRRLLWILEARSTRG